MLIAVEIPPERFIFNAFNVEREPNAMQPNLCCNCQRFICRGNIELLKLEEKDVKRGKGWRSRVLRLFIHEFVKVIPHTEGQTADDSSGIACHGCISMTKWSQIMYSVFSVRCNTVQLP